MVIVKMGRATTVTKTMGRITARFTVRFFAGVVGGGLAVGPLRDASIRALRLRLHNCVPFNKPSDGVVAFTMFPQ